MPQEYIETVVLDDPLTEARRDLPEHITARIDDERPQAVDSDEEEMPMTQAWLS